MKKTFFQKFLYVSETRFYGVVALFLIFMMILSIIGIYSQSADLLFNIFMGFFGIISGFYISAYYDNKSKNRDLGQYAVMGSRLTLDVCDTITETLTEIDDLEKKFDAKQSLSKKEMILILNTIRAKLKVLQKISLSTNNQWKDFLPPRVMEQLETRERIFDVSDKKELVITEVKQRISHTQK